MIMPVWSPFEGDCFDSPGFLHVYRFSLSCSLADSVLLQCLSPSEQLRYQRLLIPEKKKQFLRSRGLLRYLLSYYLKEDPKNISLIINKYGKPEVEDKASQLYFNLTHAQDLGVLVIASTDVGIDLEYVAKDVNYLSIAEKFFQPDEFVTLKICPSARQRRTFYRLWTAKEALLKMVGCGFINPASSLPQGAYRKYFHVAPDYVAAVAVSGQPSVVRYFDVTDLLRRISEQTTSL